VRLEGKKVENDTLTGVTVYFALYFLVFTSVFALLLFEPFDLETNITAVAACFNNVGPGLAKVGPSGNYDIYSYFSKFVLSLAMLAGRLEIFPILVMCSASTWRNR
jgi:trk system potassium uptake protein TrkH